MPTLDAVQIPSMLTLNGEEYARIAPRADTSEKITKVAQGLLTQYVNGGLMLKPEDVAKLDSLLPNGFDNTSSLIAAVEKSVGQKNGQYAYTLTLDPAMVKPLEELSVMSGIPVSQIINNAWGVIVSNNMLFQIQPSWSPLYLTSEQRQSIGEKMGKMDFSAEDLTAYFAALPTQPKAVKKG